MFCDHYRLLLRTYVGNVSTQTPCVIGNNTFGNILKGIETNTIETGMIDRNIFWQERKVLIRMISISSGSVWFSEWTFNILFILSNGFKYWTLLIPQNGKYCECHSNSQINKPQCIWTFQCWIDGFHSKKNCFNIVSVETLEQNDLWR